MGVEQHVIKLNELREGSWLSNGCEEFQYKHGMALKVNNHGELVNLHPIPLTEESFVKFGFTTAIDVYNGWLSPEIDGNRIRVHFNKGNFSYVHAVASFQYVHQLQNLYFALTGEELIIKA